MPNYLKLVKPEPLIKEQSMVALLKLQSQFHKAFNIGFNLKGLYTKLLEEEHEEWIEDFYSDSAKEFDELKELADILYVTMGLIYQLNYHPKQTIIYSKNVTYSDSITDIISQIASGDVRESILCQLVYCLFGYAKGLSWDLKTAYGRVHQSNMSKLGADGKAVCREDGKILKSLLYKPPFLEDLTDGK